MLYSRDCFYLSRVVAVVMVVGGESTLPTVLNNKLFGCFAVQGWNFGFATPQTIDDPTVELCMAIGAVSGAFTGLVV